ncbi:MAG: carboxypeptidase-like regulatory domain-containing protein, partial [Blastocatellia bacterium]
YRTGDTVTITMIRGGAITGRITNSSGEPVIGIQVMATMVRDSDGVKTRPLGFGRSRQSDDRGIYRIYGLPAGAYVVSTRAAGSVGTLSAHDGDIPTYHPSSTRETAGEVTVAAGSETRGIDIRYRGEQGHTVRGILAGGGDPSLPYAFTNVSLISLGGEMPAGYAGVSNQDETGGFAIHGVMDGEYEIVARRGGGSDSTGAASTPRRVVVKGADVGGIELKLAPLAAISGKAILETSPNTCVDGRNASIEEVLIGMRVDSREAPVSNSFAGSGSAAPNEKGDFAFNGLPPTRYFIEPRLLHDDWYLKSVAAPPAGRRAGTAAVAEVSRSGVSLKSGERLSGVTIRFAAGAAQLSGKVVAATEGATLPLRMRLHLVPAEPAAADDVLRYAEATTRGNSPFVFRNLAPGRYLALARIVPDIEPANRPSLPAALDAGERAKLRQDAEAKKNEIELKPCQRMTDFAVKW